MKPFLLTILVLLCTSLQDTMACVGCRADGAMVEEQTVQAGIGFSWSVIFLLIFVFSMLSSLTWYIVRSCQRLDRIHARNAQNPRP